MSPTSCHCSTPHRNAHAPVRQQLYAIPRIRQIGPNCHVRQGNQAKWRSHSYNGHRRVTLLAHKLNLPVATGDTNALSLGVTPFLIGDLIKLVLAGALLPAVWATIDRTK